MIKVLIIEDERPAAKRLEKMLLDVSVDFDIIGKCDSIESSIAFFESGIQPDLVMLDVQLGDGLSFEIFKTVEISCPVIFTTAFDEYAIKAFELNSIDYLMKPISREKLQKSIDKFNKLSQQNNPLDLKRLVSLLDVEKRDFKQRFIVYVGEQIHTIQTTEIAYIYSVEKSTFIRTKGGKNFPVELSLDKLEQMLSPQDFFRINRQYFIAFESIKKISMLSKSRIKLLLEPTAADETLVSTARTAEFRGWLDR
jgi:DNA-binding LytR/AlgR family response regulator